MPALAVCGGVPVRLPLAVRVLLPDNVLSGVPDADNVPGAVNDEVPVDDGVACNATSDDHVGYPFVVPTVPAVMVPYQTVVPDASNSCT